MQQVYGSLGPMLRQAQAMSSAMAQRVEVRGCIAARATLREVQNFRDRRRCRAFSGAFAPDHHHLFGERR